MIVLAIDLGGTVVKMGIVKDGKILGTEYMKGDAAGGLKGLLPNIERSVLRLTQDCGVPLSGMAGVGLAFPGIVDSERNVVLSTNQKYSDAEAVDLNQWAKDKLGLSLLMENDARMALFGEKNYGSGVGYEDIVMLTIGTGIGGAAMIGGRLLKGKHFQAGCLGGHFIIRSGGHECTCGGQGCVEAEASSWRLPDLVRQHHHYERSLLRSTDINFRDLFESARRGDILSREIRDECLKIWSAGIVNMIHAYDPELVILGGGVLKSSEDILPFVEKEVIRLSWTPWGRPVVKTALLGDETALLGAYALFHQKVSHG